jgi:ribosome-associated protein
LRIAYKAGCVILATYMTKIKVTGNIQLDEWELRESFIRASGPGGQHVNKASTAVQLRFNVERSPNLPDDVRRRLAQQAASQITEEGDLIIEANRFRSQERNRAEARQRLVELVRRATRKPKRRKKTRPTRASNERRLRNKKRRGEKKRLRGRVRNNDGAY